ncbi:glutamate ABC transporter substrate-binding protein [Gordonia sp. MP11Mi]|uniref:Solute-binding protein family 3/N-terminal domain-containing protein n=1 Tax=Gordonia sp. MP11Mi TaxID=3022769 RepID=A0AA97GX49_9ACTN
MRRTSILVAVVALLATVLAACGSSDPRNLLDSIRDGKVILGTKYDQPGMGLQKPDGTIIGFDAAVSEFVVNHIADEMGVDRPAITWRETPSAQRETLINNGEVDMIAATYSINKDRSSKVDFAGPYLVTYQGLLVRQDDDTLNSLEDLNDGRKLCSVTGSTSAQNVKAQLPGVQLQEYDTYSSCVEALRRGKVDALTTDETILAGYSNWYPDEFKLVAMTYPNDACVKDAFKKAGAPFSTERYGIGMAKEYPDAVEAANRAIKAMLVAPAGGESPWEAALRENLGDKDIDAFIDRANEPDSQYKLLPDVGDLEFVTAPSTPCEGVA